MIKSAVIIGGGIGGLFTGAFLAVNDITVTVLEKNAVIGGGLQCFRRNDKIFETGMHVMGGFGKEGNLTKICNYFGILDKLDIEHIPSECMDELIYDTPGERYRIPSGREAFVNYLSEKFPEDASGIKSYVDAIYSVTEELPLFYMKEEPSELKVHSEIFLMSASRLIEEHVKNPKLREILAYLNPLYGGIEGHTPVYVHSLLNVLYNNGASRFRGGSQQLADALKGVIEDKGGRVLAGKEVTRVDVADKNVKYVVTADGIRYEADCYISAVHPAALVKLMSERAFMRGFVKRINEIPNSYSAFSLFIDLKPDKIPYIGHTCYYMEDYGMMWDQHRHRGDEWPKTFMYMTPPEARQGKYAERLLVHCIMDYDEVRKWSDTKVGHRGEEYETWKADRAERLLSRLGSVIPDIRMAIKNIYASSPLTIRDYFHTKEGSLFGYRKDSENIMLSQMSVRTKIGNLFMTGQNINLHGMCGVPLTALYTAETLLGTNYIVRQINDAFYNK